MTFADRALSFLLGLNFPARLPKGVAVMNPYQEPEVRHIVTEFFQRFYSDNNPRVYLWGINPGRLGGGVTGLPFTDPVALRESLQITHTLTGRREPSSEFIYRVIEKFGGVEEFYSRFYLTSLSPLGFTQAGLNANFYDDAALQKSAMPFIIESMHTQLSFGARRTTAVCLATGKLYKIFLTLNSEYHFFDKILPLEHPRFVMQYRRASMDAFIKKYCATLRAALD